MFALGEYRCALYADCRCTYFLHLSSNQSTPTIIPCAHRHLCCYLYYYSSQNLSSTFDEFHARRSQFYSDHRVNFYAPTCCLYATFVPPLFAFSFVFYDKKCSYISTHFAIFCYIVFAFIARWHHRRLLKTTHNCAQLRTPTHTYAQLRTTTHNNAQLRTTTHTYAQLRTTTHNYAQLRTTTHNYAQLRTTTHNYAQQRTTTHNYAQLRTTTHNYAQLRTTTHNYAQLRTTTHNYAQLRTTTHNYAQLSIL